MLRGLVGKGKLDVEKNTGSKESENEIVKRNDD
jgi:hypothetical protein